MQSEITIQFKPTLLGRALTLVQSLSKRLSSFNLMGTRATADREAAGADAGAAESLRMSAARSPVIGVLGAKGGCGATTLAINLAAALSAKLNTTLVDADFQQPAVANLLSADVPHSLFELLNRAHEVDQHLFEACRVEIAENFGVLTPPLKGEAIARANLTDLASSLQSMRSLFSSIWLVDMPRHLDKHFVTAADMLDQIVLVFEASVCGVASCQRWLRVFAELGYPEDKIICVLNRSGCRFQDVEKELKDCFGERHIHRLPNASAQIWDAAARGVPVVKSAPGQAYSRAVNDLAGSIMRRHNLSHQTEQLKR